MYLFVYGTLKRGECNHGYLDGVFVKNDQTLPCYRLMEHPLGFPVLCDDKENGQAISGEIWEVDDMTIKVLDHFEGLAPNGLFDRRRVYTEAFHIVHAYCWPSGMPVNGLLPFLGNNWRAWEDYL